MRATHAFCCVCKGATRLRLSGLLGIEYSRGGYFSNLAGGLMVVCVDASGSPTTACSAGASCGSPWRSCASRGGAAWARHELACDHCLRWRSRRVARSASQPRTVPARHVLAGGDWWHAAPCFVPPGARTRPPPPPPPRWLSAPPKAIQPPMLRDCASRRAPAPFGTAREGFAALSCIGLAASRSPTRARLAEASRAC